MSNYINREALMVDMENLYFKGKFTLREIINNHTLREIINYQPAADVRENVRGEWERVDGFTGVEAFGFKETTVEGWCCSICDFEIDVSEKSFNYCPNCGADMRGAKDAKE